jgi:hypothetical protein
MPRLPVAMGHNVPLPPSLKMNPETIQVSHSYPTEASDGVAVTGKYSFKKQSTIKINFHCNNKTIQTIRHKMQPLIRNFYCLAGDQ